MRAKLVNQNSEKMNESVIGSILIGFLSALLIRKFIILILKRLAIRESNLANKSNRLLTLKLLKITDDFISSKKDIGVSELDDRYYISLPNTQSSIKDFRILKHDKILEISNSKIQLTEDEYNNFLMILKKAQ